MLLSSIGNLAILVGIVFLVIWAVKHLSGEQLKKAGMWCVFAGVVLLLLGMIISFRSRGYGSRSLRSLPATQGYSDLYFR
jgi:uncharacterized membrane protein HdeD (DUF308 family)